jgi:hypothetical protein
MSIFTRLFNRYSGYDELAARFPGGPEPQGARWERQHVAFPHSMRYRWCVTIVVTPEGLWLQARPPAQGVQAAIMVPWAAMVRVEPTRLYWMQAARITCGEPAVGRVTVLRPVWEAAAAYWRAAQPQAAGPS